MEPGDIFENKYRIQSTVGQGGFATVYLAQHLDLGHLVAIKVLERENAEARFLREGQILARLKSPHTVRILDFGRSAEQSYLVSEFIDGEPLDTVVQRGPHPWTEVVSIVRQILLSLAEAHDAGIVHRDLKPANIMLAEGTIRVLDFGVAKVQTVDELTKSGAVVGTVRYMAPENLLGSRDVTPSADIFAVGLVVMALLTGAEPFAGEPTHSIVQHLMSDEPLRLPATVHVPRWLRTWTDRLLEKSPVGRPRNAAEALADLDRSSSVVRQTEQARSSLPTGAVLIGVFTVVFGLGFILLHVIRAPTEVTPPPATNRPLRAVVTPSPQNDAPDRSAAWAAGLDSYQRRDWIAALQAFREIHDAPTSQEAKRLADGDYVRKAIDEVIALPPSAGSERDLEIVLKLFPDDRLAQARLRAVRGRSTPSQKSRRIKIESTGGQVPASRGNVPAGHNDLLQTEADRREWERKYDARNQ